MARIDRVALKAATRNHAETLCREWWSEGKKLGKQWVVGNVNGEPGRSLRIELEGEKAGLAYDFETGEGCDLIELIKRRTGLRFAEIAREISRITGENLEEPATQYTTGSRSGPRYRTSGTGVVPCDWDRDYQLSTTDIDELVRWRVYSREFVEWAVKQRLVGRRRKFGQWAFPFHDKNGKIVAAHIRSDKNKWIYLPKLTDAGLALAVLVIGSLATAEKIFLVESQWDGFAIADRLGIHYGEPIAIVCTRGASNAALAADIQVQTNGAEIFVVPQNDVPGQAWAEKIGTILSASYKLISVPEKYHDANDWLKDLTDINELVEAIRNAASKEPQPPKKQAKQTKAERSKAFGKSMVSGSKFASIQIPPKEIIIWDWLREGEVGFIYAYRGIGKTWMTLNLCIAVSEGISLGPWDVPVAYPVLYVDGEMSHGDNVERIVGLYGKIPENLHILNHEVLFHQSGQVINLANHEDQEILLERCLILKIKVLVLDNLSCLFVGVGENEADEWDKVKPWLLDLRRHNISPIIVHHTGYDQTRMRGTSSREDSASCVLRLENKKDTYDKIGAHFISRFTKYRGKSAILDYEWKFEPDSNGRIIVSVDSASRDDVFLQWVRDGLVRCEAIAHEMGISPGQASKIATRLINLGKLRKSGRDYAIT